MMAEQSHLMSDEPAAWNVKQNVADFRKEPSWERPRKLAFRPTQRPFCDWVSPGSA
jgi:hypothetical protein